MTKKRIDWLDISKAIAILFMVIGHTPRLLPGVRTLIFSFHMPLFFLLSGYTFRIPSDSMSFLKKSVKRLLLPYTVTVLMAAGLHFTKQSLLLHTGNPFDNFFYYIKAGLYGSGVTVKPFSDIPAIGSIWFLPCLFLARLMFLMILKIARENKTAAMLLSCITTCVGAVIGQFVFLAWSADIAMFSCGFLYLGYCARTTDPTAIKWQYLIPTAIIWLGAVSAGGIELAGRRYPVFPFCIAGAAAGTLLTVKCAELLGKLSVIKRALCFLGRHSLLILCVHKIDAVAINWGIVAARLECNKLLKSLLIASARIGIALAGTSLSLGILQIFKILCYRGKPLLLHRKEEKSC
ncbi:MAG: acyltransferase family protein [Clostridiales bacterium]|nr:acyltransferase family protein [Clostridiales bacterium]